jgi:membrane protein DedA with SNARE-associated domain
LLYLSIGLLAAVENIFPPVPADTVVAFGAFLAGRGVLDFWSVFAVTWTGNVGSAALVYLFARRYGRSFFAGRLGRRLLSDATLAHIQQAYARHGTYGIFLSRLLPVWRAVVPPFAGVAGVGAVRALVPLALASALWYGLLTAVVATLGNNFDLVVRVLARVNTALGIAAVALLVIFGVWSYRRLKR